MASLPHHVFFPVLPGERGGKRRHSICRATITPPLWARLLWRAFKRSQYCLLLWERTLVLWFSLSEWPRVTWSLVGAVARASSALPSSQFPRYTVSVRTRRLLGLLMALLCASCLIMAHFTLREVRMSRCMPSASSSLVASLRMLLINDQFLTLRLQSRKYAVRSA